MRKNKVKKFLREGKVVIGTMVHELAFAPIVQILSTVGFDCVVIDSEHAFFNLETVNNMIWAARAADITPIVRVPSRKYHHVMSKPLDAGAQGLLFPRVETEEEVRGIIKSTKYYPLGERGYHIGFAEHDYVWPKDGREVAERMKETNEETLIILQIESKLAVDNIERLVSIEGVDAAMIGPADLSQTLGIPGQTQDPEVIECVRKVIKACEKHGVVSAHHVLTTDEAKKWIKEGMRLMLVGVDVTMMLDEAGRLAQDMKNFLKTR